MAHPVQTARPTRRSRRTGLALLLAGLLALTGCAANSGAEQTRTGSQTGYVGTRQLTRVPVADREKAPVVSGPRLGGSGTISSADYAGTVLVINVWGSWCPPCREEAPGLQKAAEETRGKAQFLGINNRDFGEAAPAAFVRANKISYPSIFDPSGTQLVKFAGNLPPSAIPSTLVIDAQGRIAVRILGPISADTLVDIVDDVAAGR